MLVPETITAATSDSAWLMLVPATVTGVTSDSAWLLVMPATVTGVLNCTVSSLSDTWWLGARSSVSIAAADPHRDGGASHEDAPLVFWAAAPHGLATGHVASPDDAWNEKAVASARRLDDGRAS